MNRPSNRDLEAQNYPESYIEIIENGCLETIITFLSYFLAIITLPFSLCYTLRFFRHYERAIIFRHGKLKKLQEFGPGVVTILPCIDDMKYADLRISCYTVPLQEVMSQDSLTLTVDAVIFYRICNVVSAAINVADYKSSTQLLAATTLRKAIGCRQLNEILTDRIRVRDTIFEEMQRVTLKWGVKIERVEIKDIYLPLTLQKSMAAEEESTRLANAKIIVAKAEIEATRSLKKATELLMDNPYSMQLRYLQTLNAISGSKCHTYVLPFSVDLLKKIFSEK